MRAILKVMVGLCGLGVIGGASIAQSAEPTVIPLIKLLGDVRYEGQTLSPNGSALAYFVRAGRFDNQVCLYTFATQSSACQQLTGRAVSRPFWSPDSAQFAFVLPGDETDSLCILSMSSGVNTCVAGSNSLSGADLFWSPDNTQIAVHIEPIGGDGVDTDLLVADATNGLMSNLSDDGYAGTLVDAPLGLTVDYLPTWHSNGDLYFLRSLKAGGLWSELALYRITSGGSEPEMVAELPFDPLDMSTPGLNMPPLFGDQMTISPDGQQIALAVRSLAEMTVRADSQVGGIWLVSLTDGAVRQLAKTVDFELTLPQSYHNTTWTDGALWTADSSGLIVPLRIPTQLYAVQTIYWLYHVEISSGTVTPLITAQFSDDEEVVEQLYDQNFVPALYVVLNEQIVTVGYTGALTMLSVQPGNGFPTTLLDMNELDPSFRVTPFTPFNVSDDGKMVVDNYLLTFEE